MTSALTVPEETTWVSDFGPIPYDALDLSSKPYEVRSYWLADFRLKAIGEALGFAANFESPEVFSAYLDIKGDEGYIYFEIKTNTRPMTLSLRYSADRWSAVDGRGAHTTRKISHSETAVKSRGALTVYHAFLDKELLNKVCEQLEIPIETQEKLLTRINFKEKTYSLVAPEDAAGDFPSQKPYKTSIIPISPIKAGESMNAQEEMADATQTQTASAEPSTTETAASDSNATQAVETSATDAARADLLAWVTSEETPAHDSSPAEKQPEAPVVENAVEAAPPSDSPAVEAPAPEAETSTQAAEVATPAAEVQTPAAEVPTPAAEVQTPSAEVSTPAGEVSTPSAEVSTPSAEVSTSSAEVSTPAVEAVNAEAPVETAAEVSAPSSPAEQASAAVEAPAEPEKKKAEMWKTPAELRSEKPATQNAAKTSDSGVLGKLAVKNNDEKQNRDKRDNRENNKDRSNNSQGRTNFAPQNNRSLEAPRPVESTPKYHTYSQSEVDSLIKKSAENVANSVTSKINKQTKVVEETLKNQEFAFKQALEQINKQAEAANQKLDKAVAELTSASAKQKTEYKESFEKEIEEFKSQINKKVNQGIKVIDSKLEQVPEVKKQKPAPTPKAAPAAGPNINPNLLFAILAVVILCTIVNVIISFNSFERISNLENAAKTTTSPSTTTDVPIPDLMKDQINKETTTAPSPVQP